MMVFAVENWFLIFLGLVWIIGAVMMDLRRREVDNIWNFSLIGIALSYRAFVSIFISDFTYFANGLIGFGLFLLLGNLFYYGRVFAGGDAKLLIALGAVLPLSYNWLINLKLFIGFIIGFLALGSMYVLIYSLFLVSVNFVKFKSSFLRHFRSYKNMFWVFVLFVIFWVLLLFIISEVRFVFVGLSVLLFPLFFLYAKAVEESCLVRKVRVDKLGEGEWLAEDIRVNGNVVKSRWNGLSKEELKLLRKYYRKEVWIKQGIPFTPAFLLGFIGLLYLAWYFPWVF